MSEESRGQQIRREIRKHIEASLGKYCPNTLAKMSNLIAYDFNLTPDTLRYNYLPMFVDAGILEYNHDNLLVLSAKGKGLQTTEDGLTEQELAKEFQEENENRNQLGRKPLSFEEYVKMRGKRIKPLQR